MFKKLKGIKEKMKLVKSDIKKNEKKDPAPITPENEKIDTQPLPGIKYLQRRQMATQKRYFDSADHFLSLYQRENTEINHELLHTPSKEIEINHELLHTPSKEIEINHDLLHKASEEIEINHELLHKASEEIATNEEKSAQPGEIVKSVQGPIDTAYSEIIEEMKPKESV
ncbi:hypothetical protein NEPAR04_1727 [Nematocida parisii]|nr:hypothetical protein NEPAR08_1818 [Nematocida parisii]KAI5130975.1 hypothetical protein NEPAR03_2260 [Nematocida parisii]KAI5143062.1 hypothetical protein NEPAR04_1727 [Nematocida parisii]